MEQLTQTLAVLQSLQAALPFAPKILVCDATPSESEVAQLGEQDSSKWREAWRRRDAYDQYLAALREDRSSCGDKEGHRWSRVELMQLSAHGHLVGTVRAALDVVTTPLVLVTQHDLVLDPPSVRRAWPAIERALRGGLANCVTVNRDAHASARSLSHWHLEPALDLRIVVGEQRGGGGQGGEQGGGSPASGCCCQLTACVGFSDQCHFAAIGWYRSRVLGAIAAGTRTCMEHVLHEAMRDAYAEGGGSHERTFLLGALRMPPVLHDLVHGQMGAEREWIAAPHAESEWRPIYERMRALEAAANRGP